MCDRGKRDYQESVITGQTSGRTNRQTDAGQRDPYVPQYFAGNTIKLLQLYSMFFAVLYGHTQMHSYNLKIRWHEQTTINKQIRRIVVSRSATNLTLK